MKKVNFVLFGKRAVCLLLCLVMIAGIAGCKAKTPENENLDLGVIITEPTETEAAKELSVTDLLKAVTTLKDDLETALDGLKENDIAVARQKAEGLSVKTETIRTSLNVTLENLGDSSPSLRKELLNIQELLNLADQLAETILMPAIEMMEGYTASDMQETESVRMGAICDYLDFAETLIPAVEKLLTDAEGVDFSLVDSDGKMAEMLLTAEDLVEEYRENPAILTALKTILGDGRERTYLVAAQNSAEIRASGGFPGAMGVIRIQNGSFVMQDFKKVYNVLAAHTPAAGNVTQVENKLFHYGLQAPRDSDYCPDFERAAQIWALGYKSAQTEEVDGVISMTPAFVQRMLAAMDEEIKLFDGTVLNGRNAVRVLQHDLYFKYFGAEYVQASTTVTDQLFADAAKKTMQKFQENMEISDLMAYLSVFKESVEDRTFLLWMAEEEEQAVIRQLGWHGGLNENPEKPQAGVYFNCIDASKMGWFLKMDTQMGERTQNNDGSYTYPITITLSNIITEEEKRTAQQYIIGRHGGAINGSIYFFAPAGGTVTDFVISNGRTILEETYKNLQLGYLLDFDIRAGEPITVTYNVTTAPGVETPLEFSKTPTVQAYH